MSPLVVEVFDGSHLVFADDGLPRKTRSELEVWALVPERGAEPTTRGEPSVWQHALEAGPLLYVVFQGIVGNAAWEIFPAAGRYLHGLWRRPQPALDAESAATRAREAVAAVADCEVDDIAVTEASRDGEGVWRLRFEIVGGRRGKARIDARATVTHVEIKGR